MKLVEKTRVGSKVKKKYDKPRTPYQRLLECPEVSRKIKGELRREHRELDAIGLARAVEQKLVVIYGIVERIEEEREKLREWAGGALPLLRSSPGPSNRGKSLPEQSKRRKNRPSLGCHESWCNDPPPSVSSFIGSTREDNCNYEKPEHGLSWREFRILTAILSWPTTREGFTSIGWESIQFRSCGFVNRKEFKAASRIPDHLPKLSRRQIRSTLDTLEALNFFARFRQSTGPKGGRGMSLGSLKQWQLDEVF